MQTLSCSVIGQVFPGGTVDPGFTFIVTGTLADGTVFSTSSTGISPTASFDLAPGTYTGAVSKLGITSLLSDPLTIVAPASVTLSVPDATMKAALA